MAILDQLLPASFKGAEFLIKTSSTEGGRKTVTHEFPNSDKRFVEDLGLLNKTFNITGIIGDPNYFEKRDALLAALESAGEGLLVHPFFGQVNVVALPYTISQNDTALGEASITMSFQVSEPNQQPTQTSNNFFLVNRLKENNYSFINLFIEDSFNVGNKFFNFDDAAEKVSSIGSAFLSASTGISNVTDEFNEYTNSLVEFQQKANSLVNQPSLLAASITELLQTSEGITLDPFDQYNFIKNLFGFGKNDVAFNLTTSSTVERQKNRDTLNNSINAGALSQAYQVATTIDYETTDQLDQIRKELENQYSLIDKDNIPSDLKNGLIEIRNQTREFLDELEQDVARITDFKILEYIPAKILSYQQYGGIDRANQIISLNKIKNAAFVKGDLRLITNV